jgi:hypothetical protein
MRVGRLITEFALYPPIAFTLPRRWRDEIVERFAAMRALFWRDAGSVLYA